MRRIGKVFLLGVVVGLVLAAARALREAARPAPVPALSPAARALAPPEPTATAPPAAVPEAIAPARSAEGVDDAAPAAPAAPATPAAPTVDGDAPAAPTWVPPVGGVCPEGYPIKVKVRSGIYHRLGGLSYARTVPDRCYPTAETAEADGFRPALR